ncbi:MAG: hypothetical protein ACK5HE_02120 [Bacteroidota bacterium]
MISLVTEYPIWLSILCIALGVLYAYLLYGKQVSYEGLPKGFKYFMTAGRAVVVSIISFLLLSPLIKTVLRTVEKPLVVIAQDNSSSIGSLKDSAFLKNEFQQQLKALKDELSDKYEVRTYLFGSDIHEEMSPDFGDKASNMEVLFEELENRYANRNLGAVIISSDGLYNEGENPLYESNALKCPVYTVALGDTTVRKDLILSRVNHNKTVYSGNSFPLEIVMQARMLKGRTAKLMVEHNNNTVYEQNIEILSSGFSKSIPLQLKAEGTGTLHYIVKLLPLEDEISLVNNVQHVFIDVITNRQKVLILADAPHPDISALRQTIEKNESYEAEFSLIGDWSKTIAGYNLLILHQLPSSTNNNAWQKIMNELQKSDVSRLFVCGNNTNFNAFNSAQKVMGISGVRPKFNEVIPAYNKEFALFNLSEDAKKAFAYFSPLQVPFGNIQISNGATVFCNQKLGVVTTDQALIAFNELNGVKEGIILGEGIWRWKLSNYQQLQNHEAFEEIFGKIIQYFSVKTDKRLFRVNYQNTYKEGDNIEMDAVLYNDSYEPIVDPDIRINIMNEAGKSFGYQFSKNESAYFLNIPGLPIGNYRFEASTKVGNKTLKENGSFTVKQVNIEALNTTADHQLLNAIAQKTGGKMVFPQQLNQLAALIQNKEEIVPVSYTEEKLQDLVNLKWVFFLLISLLTAEWFLRKRFGGY